ncbi:MAG: MoxR family ATPase [Acidibacillus sp.]|nr:MoxR family ATPase [Acidibacillus sp.]
MKDREFKEAKKRAVAKAASHFQFDAKYLQAGLAKNQYFISEEVCRKIVHYLAQNKPIGLRGEPGVGKSELPQQIARLLSADVIDIECHSELEAADIGISWNSFRQLMDAQMLKVDFEPFSLPYLNRTPLLQSLLAKSPVVVRVDEVDKLNETTSNFFLRYLDKRELIVHDLVAEDKALHPHAPIYVFLTSNDYRELDPALMRRIAWIHLTFPSEEQLAEILSVKAEIPLVMARRISFLVRRLRDLSLIKKPSIGESIEWAQALLLETDGNLTIDALHVTLGFVLKYAEDERKGWEAMQSWFLGENTGPLLI